MNIFTWIKGLFIKEAVRKFYSVKGFGDDTEYIKWVKGGATTVSMSGARLKCRHIKLSWLEDCVADGTYEEVSK
ncbi:hypothetical protein LCGC14_1855110 [marine sediment metagenome]|uniref:Uncharacterized protein n=1 Tax=marine sediment metagenome TaxID=412755 RepID=A0A0F9J8E8_9ZZZZ